jgi:hypothetical protein
MVQRGSRNILQAEQQTIWQRAISYNKLLAAGGGGGGKWARAGRAAIRSATGTATGMRRQGSVAQSVPQI